jgi:hypothetical protein
MAVGPEYVKHQPTGKKMQVVAFVCLPADGGPPVAIPLSELKPWIDPHGVASSKTYTYDPND